MGKHTRHLHRGEYLEPTAIMLLGKPLEFIHEDHLRERQICSMLDAIAQGTSCSETEIADILGFLTTELPMHLKDEEEDLFPLLRRRCEPEDEIEKVIAKLQMDHHHAGEDTPQVVSVLEVITKSRRRLETDERKTLTAYASHSRRHLILENAIILPFARLRLTAHDLETLYVRMCQRRGIKHLNGAEDTQRST